MRPPPAFSPPVLFPGLAAAGSCLLSPFLFTPRQSCPQLSLLVVFWFAFQCFYMSGFLASLLVLLRRSWRRGQTTSGGSIPRRSAGKPQVWWPGESRLAVCLSAWCQPTEVTEDCRVLPDLFSTPPWLLPPLACLEVCFPLNSFVFCLSWLSVSGTTALFCKRKIAGRTSAPHPPCWWPESTFHPGEKVEKTQKKKQKKS